MNPNPKKPSSLTFFHRDLNGITAHDFDKISLIQSYALSYNTDIIFLPEIFFYSSVEASDPNNNFPGYNSLRSDHPSNTRRGVCMFYRRDDHCAFTECIVTEIRLEKKSIFFY